MSVTKSAASRPSAPACAQAGSAQRRSTGATRADSIPLEGISSTKLGVGAPRDGVMVFIKAISVG